MRHSKLLTGLALAALVLWAAGAGAAEGRIGVVDFQRILDESAAGKAAQAEINKRGKEMETELKAKGEELEKIKAQLQREAMVMSKEMREDKEREFRIKVNDFREMQKDYAKSARELQIRAMGRIRNEIDKLASAVGEKEGFALIIEKQEAGVLYAPTSSDLTARIIERYDAEVKQPAQTPAKAQ